MIPEMAKMPFHKLSLKPIVVVDDSAIARVQVISEKHRMEQKRRRIDWDHCDCGTHS